MYVCTCRVHVLIWLPQTQNQTHPLNCWLNKPPHSALCFMELESLVSAALAPWLYWK